MITTEAVELFLRYIVIRKKRSAATVTTYKSILRQFVSMTGNKEVSAITIDDIDQYADMLSVKNYAPKTYRCKLSTIRSFVRFLYVKDYTNIKPEQIDVPPDDKGSESTYLDLEEAQAFISVVHDVRDRAMMLFLLATWGRVSEVANVRLEDIRNRSVIIKKGKGAKDRTVFINEETEQAINAYIAQKRGIDNGPLFPNPHGKSLSRQYIHRKVKFYAAKAGINKVVKPHTLRHTGASCFLDAGGSIEVAQQILGHTKLETTLIYAHFKDERLHRDYDAVTKQISYSTI